ncbi:hypothetical protein FSP39_020220 [Pinctada imbricata]|uniref:Hexosyltransferase n=1 Tax=Pinctada imbricata TaxID=66713 RepID=A0AA88YK96_PINIB|nr:hypothetical protein FSP39_020220 [Pinctada imbricata]
MLHVKSNMACKLLSIPLKRPHKKLLTFVGAGAFLCILISFLKADMSKVYTTNSYISDCLILRTKSDIPLPSECRIPRPSQKQSNVPISDKFVRPNSGSAGKPPERKVKKSKSRPNRTMFPSKDDEEKKTKTGAVTKDANDTNMTRFQFTINEENLCKTSNNTSVVLLVGVFSGRNEAPIRKFIRTNWGKVVNQNQKVKIVFILGEAKQKSLLDETTIEIRNESKKYHDIVEANFADTYRNLTYKSLALFQWIGSYCSNAKYVLKIDGDMKIDLQRLLGVLEKGNFPDKYQCGYLIPAHAPMRDKNSKWYVPKSIFPGNYSLYCSGPAYIVSKRIAEKISHYPIPKIPFPVDDAFMTGVLRVELHEGVEKRIISFYHHHNPTDTVVKEGNFKKYIMKIDVRG